MNTDDLERQLEAWRVKAPAAELRERVLGAAHETWRARQHERRAAHIRVWRQLAALAAGLAVCTGVNLREAQLTGRALAASGSAETGRLESLRGLCRDLGLDDRLAARYALAGTEVEIGPDVVRQWRERTLIR